ncbi:MAG: hypothetical protein KI785_14080 [Devosiaceae bacterium]|nr:hypothetical protein [Devosiaceae bacterium MH13]
MLRIAVINLALFLVPFALYLLWTTVRGKRTDMPFYWLIGSGAALVLVAMVTLAQFETGGSTGEYEPARVVDGEIVPGRFVEPTE